MGLIVLPAAWWLMAYWQKRRKLKKLSVASLYWSATPMLSFVALYLGAEDILIPPIVAGIVFFLTPVINTVALIVVAILTVTQSN